MLIFLSPYFLFCLHAKAVMAAHFSFVIEGIKEVILKETILWLSFFSEKVSLFGAISFGLI